METSIRFDTENNTVSVHLLGDINLADGKAAIDQVVLNVQYEPTMHILCDVSNSDLSELHPQFVEEILEHAIMRLTALKASCKIAFVSANADNFTLLRLFEEYQNDKENNAPLRTFKKIKDAKAWLKT